MKEISAAFVKAQRNFEPARKSSENPHFRSKYADLATCVDAVLTALNAEGIALVQKTHECGDGVMVETVFVHESGEQFSGGLLHVPAAKNDPQGYGSALTYARRYSLLSACGIAPEDDDANQATASYQAARQASPQAAPKPPQKAPAKEAKVEASPEAKDALWRKCLEAANGNSERAEHILKLCSVFKDTRGNEQFLTLEKLSTASEKYVSSTMKNFDNDGVKQKIDDYMDSIPF